MPKCAISVGLKRYRLRVGSVRSRGHNDSPLLSGLAWVLCRRHFQVKSSRAKRDRLYEVAAEIPDTLAQFPVTAIVT